MPSKDMGGTRGSGAGAKGYGQYGRGGAKPSSKTAKPASKIAKPSNKAAKNMSSKSVVARELRDPWHYPKKPVGRNQIAEARYMQKALKTYKPTAAQKNSNARFADSYTGGERQYRIKQLKVGSRSVKQTTAASKKNPASTRKVVPKPYPLYFPPNSKHKNP